MTTLMYIIQVKGFSWPYLISKILVAYNYSYNAASNWPRTFFTPRLFLFNISLLFVSMMLNKNSLAVKKVRGQSEAIMAISDQKL